MLLLVQTYLSREVKTCVHSLVSKYTDFPQFSKPREICCKNKTSHKGSNEDPSHGAHSEIQQGPQLLAWSLLSNA